MLPDRALCFPTQKTPLPSSLSVLVGACGVTFLINGISLFSPCRKEASSHLRTNSSACKRVELELVLFCRHARWCRSTYYFQVRPPLSILPPLTLSFLVTILLPLKTPLPPSLSPPLTRSNGRHSSADALGRGGDISRRWTKRPVKQSRGT